VRTPKGVEQSGRECEREIVRKGVLPGQEVAAKEAKSHEQGGLKGKSKK